MKRLAPILLLLLLIALGAAIVAPKMASEERLRAEALAVLKQETGQEPQLGGSVSFSVLPWPTVNIEQLSFGAPGKASISVPDARLVLEIMPLLTGQVRAYRIDLDHPEFVVPDGDSGRFDRLTALVATLGSEAGATKVRVKDGSVVIRRRDGEDIVLRQLAGTFAWRGGRDLQADGSAVWRGEPVEFDIDVTQLAALAKGQPGRARLSLSGAPFTLSFDGSLTLAGGPVAEGDLQVSSSQLRDVLGWIGLTAPTEQGFGAFALRARALFSGSSAALSNARVELDGNSSEGGVNVRVDKGRTVVQGSFASGNLDLSPYGRLAMSEPNGREWNRTPVDVSRLGAMDLDLRLSAAQVRAGSSRFDGLAASALLKGGRLALTVGEAEAWNGVFRASANVAPAASGEGAEIHVDLAGNDVDLAASLGDLFKLQRLEGTGTFRIAFGGTGLSVSDIVDNLNGAVTLSAGQGGIVGVDVARVLARLERRPLSGGGSLRGGRTDFDRLDAKATIAKGVAHVDDLSISSSAIRIAVTGDVSLAGRDLDLKGTAGLVHPAPAAGAPPADNLDLPFVIQGPWDSPFLLPDAQAMIRRSGAARPLLSPGPAAIGVSIPTP